MLWPVATGFGFGKKKNDEVAIVCYCFGPQGDSNRMCCTLEMVLFCSVSRIHYYIICVERSEAILI